MNERIKELWGQATFDESRMIGGVYHPYIPLQYGGEPIRYSITEDQIEKLAELIIRECVRCVTQPTIQAEFPHDIAIREVQNVLANEMKFHFGVE